MMVIFMFSWIICKFLQLQLGCSGSNLNFEAQMLVVSYFYCKKIADSEFIKRERPWPDCESPIKLCKWPVWVCWIYFRHPMGSLEVLWCQFFIDQSLNFFASQLLIRWIFNIILHTKANPKTEPIKINLYLC